MVRPIRKCLKSVLGGQQVDKSGWTGLIKRKKRIGLPGEAGSRHNVSFTTYISTASSTSSS